MIPATAIGQPVPDRPALAHATCDLCGHLHACFVGGAPVGPDGRDWQRHVCLGCLARAVHPEAAARCDDCPAEMAR